MMIAIFMTTKLYLQACHYDNGCNYHDEYDSISRDYHNYYDDEGKPAIQQLARCNKFLLPLLSDLSVIKIVRMRRMIMMIMMRKMTMLRITVTMIMMMRMMSTRIATMPMPMSITFQHHVSGTAKKVFENTTLIACMSGVASEIQHCNMIHSLLHLYCAHYISQENYSLLK